jgi:hypothetical protein
VNARSEPLIKGEEVIYSSSSYVSVLTVGEIKPRLENAKATAARTKLAKEMFANYKLKAKK